MARGARTEPRPAAGVEGTTLDAAWGSIPPSRRGSVALGSFTRTRVERIIAIATAVGCLILGTQGFVAALGLREERGGWHTPLLVLTFAPLAVMLIACVAGRAIRVSAGVFASLYLVSLVLWAVATLGTHPEATGKPWIFYLINVATVSTILAFRLPLQIAWTIATPLLYGLVRLFQGGFARDFWIAVPLDVSFALILGGILTTLGWVFRSVAANVDETRMRAVSSYASASAADAVEQERVAVGALMHDSVLAALIAAARAESPRERTLAVSMAREALTRLANAERDSEMGSVAPVGIDQLADELQGSVAELGSRVRVARRFEGGEPHSVPGVVARALVLAATQAVTNALQHANGVGLEIVVESHAAPERVSVRVRDSGPGFDLAAVPDDRLGISASVVARVTAVGGRSHIDSGRGGTTVTLEWAEAF